jgi:hypothetical protein
MLTYHPMWFQQSKSHILQTMVFPRRRGSFAELPPIQESLPPIILSLFIVALPSPWKLPEFMAWDKDTHKENGCINYGLRKNN